MKKIKQYYSNIMRGPWYFRWIKKIGFWFFVVSFSWVLIYKWIPVPLTFFMFQRCIVQKYNGEEMRLKKNWKPIEDISNHLQLAVVCAEDQNYLTHSGFDLKAIKRAVDFNDKMEDLGKNKRRGASTISQQTAKNVFLWHGRSFIRKGFEVYFTALIEVMWSKKRIMEVYLNVIEFGNGVYGAEAAAKSYLNKSAKNISTNEAALMAVVLPNPRKFSIAKPSAYIKKRQNWCAKQMRFWGGRLVY